MNQSLASAKVLVMNTGNKKWKNLQPVVITLEAVVIVTGSNWLWKQLSVLHLRLRLMLSPVVI